jgi:hypothetical protein
VIPLPGVQVKLNKRPLFLALTLAVTTAACGDLHIGGSKSKKVNRVTNEPSLQSAFLGDENVTLPVYSKAFMEKLKFENKLVPVLPGQYRHLLNKDEKNVQNSKRFTTNASMVVGIPFTMINQDYVFGAVITKVSEPTDENLGGLKLTDLTPLHIKLELARTPDADGDGNEDFYVVFKGCAFKCEASSEQQNFFVLPVKTIDVANEALVLDLSNLGENFELINLLGGKERYSVDTVGMETVAVEFSDSTLVFDIKSKIVPSGKDPQAASTPKADLTARWYLKPAASMNTDFAPRSPVKEVGFFQTERSLKPLITRFALPSDSSKKIHYFIKNVPKEHKATFKAAFDHWNKEFKATTGRDDLLSYEFIDQADPRSKLIVAGDIRYNVMEWDLDNAASYGGLGPSIANQYTGETLTANVLIQGPKIVEIYKKWFATSAAARRLLDQGLAYESREMMAKFNKELLASKSSPVLDLAVKAASGLNMRVHSQRPELEDPIAKGSFDLVPAGVTYESYMHGYFSEMLEHELGHNFGLRHNFKGNLGAAEAGTPVPGARGSVSRSIMEYLGKTYRHLNAIGDYDRMALSYGYMGKKPLNKNWFCTDQDAVSNFEIEITPWTPEIMIRFSKEPINVEEMKTSSAECTKSDAGKDPFSFWQSRLARGLELMLETRSTQKPLWKFSEIKKEMNDTVLGLGMYAMSAEKTSDTWSNFFGQNDRPKDKKGVPSFVLSNLRTQICGKDLDDLAAKKDSAEARDLAQTNLTELRDFVAGKLVEYTMIPTKKDLCL